MEVLYERCCGIDVHKKVLVCCFKCGKKQEIRTFGSNNSIMNFCAILFIAATSNHGNPTAAREVKPVVDNPLFSFVVGIASSLVAAWLYDMIRHSGKH